MANKNMFKTISLIITLNILINISITKSTPHKSQNDLPSIGINEVKIGHNNNHNNNNKILDDEMISSKSNNNNNENDYSSEDGDNDDDADNNNDFDDESDIHANAKTITATQSTVDEQIKLLSKQLNALTERRQDDLKSLESNLRKYVRKNAVQILNEDLKRELEDLR